MAYNYMEQRKPVEKEYGKHLDKEVSRIDETYVFVGPYVYDLDDPLMLTLRDKDGKEIFDCGLILPNTHAQPLLSFSSEMKSWKPIAMGYTFAKWKVYGKKPDEFDDLNKGITFFLSERGYVDMSGAGVCYYLDTETGKVIAQICLIYPPQKELKFTGLKNEGIHLAEPKDEYHVFYHIANFILD